MMALYDKPVRVLMKDMVSDLGLSPGEVLQRSKVLEWFNARYPKVKEATILAHLSKMSTNVPSRVHYKANPSGDDDLFFRIDPKKFRLYDQASDPSPIYEGQPEPHGFGGESGDYESEDAAEYTSTESSKFAYEKDLQSYLARNLYLIEPGLRIYEEEEITGIEFPAGGRFIDILAIDTDNNYVVIELKVSKGYDRVVGQLLRYMAWIEKHHADEGQSVRGVIIAKEISEDLRLASSRIKGLDLFEYRLSVSLESVYASN